MSLPPLPQSTGLEAPFFEARHDAYRRDVRAVLSAWAGDQARQWDVDGHLPKEVMVALGEVGAFRRRWEEGPFGGVPFGLILAEETGRVSSGLGQAAMTHSDVFLGVLHYLARTPTQLAFKEDCLDARAVGCFSVTEASAGSNLRSVQTTAFPVENGGWRLRGRKKYVSNAGRGTHVIVLARAANLGQGRDLSLFLVPLDAPGVTVHGYFRKLGVNACDTAEMEFDVVLPADALLGTPGAGLLFADFALQGERMFISVQSLMGARTMLRLALAYARSRQVAGDEPLLQKQAIRHRLADALARLRAAEALLIKVVSAAMAGEQVGTETCALKLVATRTACEIVDEALQVLGGRGYMTTYPVESHWRDARLGRIGGGTDEVMRETIAFSFDAPDPEYDQWAAALDAADQSVPEDDVVEDAMAVLARLP